MGGLKTTRSGWELFASRFIDYMKSKKKKNSKDKILSGIAGEYFVAGELSRRGYIASITLRNTAHVDILASNGKQAINIQVKTKCIERSEVWALGGKPLEYKNIKDTIFYVFVAIHSDPNDKKIDYYIISKKELNKKVENSFQKHLLKPREDGKPRTTKIRNFGMKDFPELQTAKYKDNWNQLFK